MIRVSLADDGFCFACGMDNSSGLRLEFRGGNGRVTSEFVPQKAHQGFKDIVHGGIITTILDEAMVKAVLSLGIEALTAEITVRFKMPLLVGEKAFIEAEINKIGNRLVETSARIRKADASVVAEAGAKLLRNA